MYLWFRFTRWILWRLGLIEAAIFEDMALSSKNYDERAGFAIRKKIESHLDGGAKEETNSAFRVVAGKKR